MRIGLVTGEYPPAQGGVGDFTHELGCALAQLGHEVHIVTDKSQIGKSANQEIGKSENRQIGKSANQEIGKSANRNTDHESRNTQYGTRMPEVLVHRVVEGWGWGCWGQVLGQARELGLEVLDVQYQAAAYGLHPAINFVPRHLSQLPGGPAVVVTFHDLKAPYLFPKAGPLRWQVVRMLARRASGVVVTNQEDYVRLEGVVAPERLSLIPIGSNIPFAPPVGYDRDGERARWGVGPGDLLLGYFGFLNESKGGEELVQALAILVERGLPAHLLMVGGRFGSSDPTNRSYAQRVDGLIAGLNVQQRVHWTGYTRPEEVSAGLLATDVCVLPYRDGVSLRRGTLHACLVHGRALVTTRPALALPEVRDGENMLLVAPRDPQGLAEAVMRLAADTGLRARLETKAMALAAGFTWERIARQTAAFVRRLQGGATY